MSSKNKNFGEVKDLIEGQTFFCEACEWENNRPKTTAMPIHTCGKEKCNCQYEQGHSIACPLYKERAFKPSWEAEFENLYSAKVLGEYGSIFKNDVKDFISQTIKTEREQAVKEYEYLLKQKIGSLRQWLNEDRIDSLRKMVSSEQLEKWLIN